MRQWVPVLAFVGVYLPFGILAWKYNQGERYEMERFGRCAAIVMLGVAVAIAVAQSLEGWATRGP